MKAESKAELAPWKNDEIARRIAEDIPDGSYVNLGIGMPELVANHIPPGKELVFHSENGLLGMGPSPGDNARDPELINAGKKPVTVLPGGSFFHHADSFAMIRGGHIDVCVMGGMQVSCKGDLANWSTGGPDAIPAVGGAMDLAASARAVYIFMTHTTKTGEFKLVDEISYPATALGCVKRVYTDLAVIDITAKGFCVREMCPGMTLAELKKRTGAPLSNV